MASPLRDHLYDALVAGLPGDWTVVGYPSAGFRPTGPTVMLYTERIEPPAAGATESRVQYIVEVITDRQDPKYADDDLDNALMTVYPIIWAMPSTVIGTAERTTIQDKIQAWTLTVSSYFNLHDPDQED